MVCYTTGVGITYSQSNKIKITQGVPGNLQVCGKSDTFSFELRNITIGTISGITAELSLPNGIRYEAGSIMSGGATELNISNLQKPVFSVSNLAITQAISIRVRVTAECNALTTLGSGGSFINRITAIYTGGTDAANSASYTGKIPSLVFNSISNKSFTGIIGEKFTRIIEIKNFGNGPLQMVSFGQKNGSGLKLLGTSGGKTIIKGDTAFHTFDTAHFAKSGNKDGWLDPNESFYIYDTIEIGACGNLLSNYWVNWGCGGKTCSIKSEIANVIIKAVAPNLAITPTTVWHSCFGADSAFSMSLMVINRGNDKARNTVIDISQAVNTTWYDFLYSRIDSSSIRMRKGKNGKDSAITLSNQLYNRKDGTWACLGNNPLSGFTWNLQEVQVGDTLILSWKVYTCCVSQCNTTKYMGGWRYAGTYYDQCMNATTITQTQAWGGLSQSFAASSFTPSDIADKQEKTLIYSISSAGFWGLNGNSKFEIDFIPAKGLEHSLNVDDFLFEAANGTFWKPSNITQYGDTVRAKFNYSSISLTQSELRIKVKGACSAISGSRSVPYQLNLYYTPNPLCKENCKQAIFCTNGSIRVHCPVSCGGGMNFKNFTVERTSFGLPDNNNDGLPDTSGVLDKSKIKSYIAMYSDTVLSTFSGIVTQSGATFFWDYGYAKSYVLYGNYLSVVRASIEIYRARTLRFSCDSVKHTSTIAGNYGTFNFDFSRTVIGTKGCAGSSGYRLASGDSVCLKISYIVSTNTGGAMLESKFDNEFYISTIQNPTGTQKRQCDTFNGNFVIAGYYFTNYGQGNYTLSGCSNLTLSQSYYLSLGPCCGNYAGGNLFRYEYRNWAKIAKSVVYLPKGYKYVSANLYYYRTSGTLGINTAFYSSIQPQNPNSDTLVFEMRKFHTDSGGSFFPSDDGFHGTLNVTVKPSCGVTPNLSQKVQYDMVFDQKGFKINTPINVPSGAQDDQLIFNRPLLKLSAVTNKILASKDTIEWIIRINNNAAASDAAFTWISSIPSKTISITSIKDQKTGLPLILKGGLYQAGQVKANTYSEYLVRAVYNSCNFDSLEINAGWDCTGYPDSIIQYECIREKAFLYLEPVPTLLQSTIKGVTGKIDLCSKIPIEISITNTDEPNAYNLQMNLDLPEGVIILDSALEYKIHRDSSFRKLNYPTLQTGNNWLFNLAGQINELQTGLKGVLDSLRKTILIRMFVETNCDFSSGSFIRVLPKGSIKCGTPVKAGISISNPIFIKNIVEPYYSDIKLVTDTLRPCSEKTRLSYRVIFLGPQSTDTADRFRFYVPQGYQIDTASFTDILKAPNRTPVLVNFNGSLIAEWTFQKGMKPGDSSLFAFDLVSKQPFAVCGITGLLSHVAVKQEALCIKDSTFCTINVSTGSNYTEKQTVKGRISFTVNSAQSEMFLGSYEKTTISGVLKNSGAQISDWQTKIFLIADRNGNHKFDGSDTLYGMTVYDSLLSGEVKSFVFNATVRAEDMCKLLLIEDTLNCDCSQIWLEMDKVQLKNAGADTLLCSGISANIGHSGFAGYKYKWAPVSYLNNDTSSSPIFKYNNSLTDTVVVSMRLQTNRGTCNSSDTLSVMILPAIQYGLDDSVFSCKKDTVLIGNIAKGGTGTLKYFWYGSSNLLNPNNAYSRIFPDSSSYFYVRIEDGAGCRIVDSIKAVVTPKPVSAFSLDLPCENTLLNFNDLTDMKTGSGNSQFYLNGAPVNNGEFTLNYPFNFKLKVVSINHRNCVDSIEKSYRTLPIGQMDFNLSPACAKNLVSFTANASLPLGTYKKFEWELDTFSFIGNTLQRLWPDTGIYRVSLKGTTDTGCTIIKDSLIEFKAKPTAVFDVGKACFGDTLNIFALNFQRTDSCQWLINQTDNFSDSSLLYLQTMRDSLDVRLMITNQFGCKDSVRGTVVIQPKPLLKFNGDTLCNYEDYIPNNQSTISKGSIAQYTWNTGDGMNYNTKGITHRYTDTGWYEVRLRALSDRGCSDSAANWVRILPDVIPRIKITGRCEGENYFFEDNSFYRNTVAANITWDLNSTIKNGVNALYTPSKGYQRIVLKTITNEGCSYQADTQFYVHPLPNVSFKDTSACFNERIKFSNLTRSDSIKSHSFVWNLGDGNISVLDSFTHVYSTPGNRRVTLTAVNAFGCADSASKSVVSYPEIYAVFDVSNVCENVAVNLTENSYAGSTSISRYKWNFGDGTVSNIRIPSKSYTAAGTYPITLEITTKENCLFDTSLNIVVHPTPAAGFTIFGEPLDIFKSNIDVKSTAIGATNYFYQISDGSSYSTLDFSHEFADSGRYIIHQKVSNTFGCSDSITNEVFVFFKYLPYIPNAFSPNQDGKNDHFGLEGIGLLNTELLIYNRWGEVIFKSENGHQKWDGTYKGTPVQPGIYLYSAKVTTYSYQIFFYHGTVQVVY